MDLGRLRAFLRSPSSLRGPKPGPPEPHTLQTDSGSLLPLTGHQPPLLGGGGSSPGVPGVEVGAEMKGPAPDRDQGEDMRLGFWADRKDGG